ncbi:MAG: O-antigen ligase family protein [Roseiflexus sp.]|nr:O-antigen ligase family protein [Roseiflexus sp.]MCS7289455.1 O-antigen ligase family protein [Roseiflexus sp.]MDW8144922.1 O-antigen ligase family protein [Roseiflexaceae bacterium]MDW8234303.1 O-antigen ligase family protein [Roseiflexaceae bacterium]
MSRLSAFVAPEYLRVGTALLIGLTVAPLAGVLAATQPFLLLLLLGAASWVVLVLRGGDGAFFVTGAVAPLLYLIDARSALFSQALLALYGMTCVHALYLAVQQPAAKQWDRRLMIAVVGWGAVVVLAERMRLGEGLSLRHLVMTVIGMLPYLWFALAAPRITANSQAHALLGGIALGATVVAGAFLLNSRSLSEGLQGRDAWIDTYTIIGSLKNSLGLLWVIGWTLLLGWRARIGWLLRAPFLAILLTAILFSFSRSSYIALIVATLLLYRGHSLKLWIIAGAISAFVLFGLPEAVWARLEMTWSPRRGFDPSAETRIELWGAAVNAFLSAPLTGIGWGKFSEYLVRTGQAPIAAGSAVYDLGFAHNYFLSAFAMLGIGGVLSVGMFLAAWRRARALVARQSHQARVVQAVILAVLASSLFGEPLFDPVLAFVFLLVLACLVGQEGEL